MSGSILKTAAAAAIALGLVFAGASPVQAYTKTRLVMMADMDNEPDEMQQNVHLFIYANEIDFEGLYAVTGSCLPNRVAPRLYDSLVHGYAQVYNNLTKHASGWPDTNYLYSIVKGGYPEYGIGAIGPGKSSPASTHLKEVLLKNDPRPVYIVVNAGSYTLGQALYELNLTKTPAQMDSICQKIIVYENGAQDDAGAWIMLRFPKILWHRSRSQTYAWAGWYKPYTWEPYSANNPEVGQHQWVHEHVQTNHGPLGALYPLRRPGDTNTVEGGGTTPWLGLANHGLFNAEKMYWGGWGGRFSRARHSTASDDNVWSKFKSEITLSEKKQVAAFGKDFAMYLADSEEDEWTDPTYGDRYSGTGVCVIRWRRATFNDFRARMDWCVKEYNQANHNPVAAVNGDTSDDIVTMSMKPGAIINLNASATTDPDDDAILFYWSVYKEAGTYTGTISIANPTGNAIQFQAPADADGKEIHVILEVRDTGNAYSVVSIYDYRRIVINVSSTTGVLNSKGESRMLNRSATVFTAGDQVIIPADFRGRGCHLAVFDMAGKCVKKAVVKNRVIALSKQLSLAPGAYIVKIKSQ